MMPEQPHFAAMRHQPFTQWRAKLRSECRCWPASWSPRSPSSPRATPSGTRAGEPKWDARGRLQIGSPEHERRRLWLLAEFAEAVAGTILEGREVAWTSFLCRRENGEGRRAGRAGYGFRIEFPEPVQGPVAVGYGAHFGMGGFVVENDNWMNSDKKTEKSKGNAIEG